MELNKELYLSKSFVMIGNSLSGCYDCTYCRVVDSEIISYQILPSEINPLFTKLPVVINPFYGDPMLQLDNTLNYLDRLEEAKHEAPVIIITKGDLSKFTLRYYNLDLHFAISTFGRDSIFDGGNMEIFKNNLAFAKTLSEKLGYKYSIEFRPIIRDINDSNETLENVFKIASEYNAPIGFCGLQVNENLKKFLDFNGIKFKPYDGYEFGLKKAISKEVEDKMYELSDEYKVPIFRKTSCLISYSHNLERDYNAHYYRPNEMRCGRCPMLVKCMQFKQKMIFSDKKELDIPIPFDYELINKTDHCCILYARSECKFPSYDCKHISGKLIKIKEKITSSDLRVIKWLTGMTVDCDFTETEFISTKWKK